MTTVHCVNQEYWTVDRTACQCGAVLSRKAVVLQELHRRAHGHVDVLRVRCERCGHEISLEFDISSFFGKPSMATYLRVLRGGRRRVREVCALHERPMDGVLQFLSALVARGDTDAIEYIADMARRALEAARR